MKLKAISGIMLTLLLLGMLTLAFNIQPVKADWTWTETIYIRADGSVEPDTAPVSTVDNITYTFTENIVAAGQHAIIVERDNIVVDGDGYTLQGVGGGNGIKLLYRNNVTIKNTNINYFERGIDVRSSSLITISRNNMRSSGIAACIVIGESSHDNTVFGNSIANDMQPAIGISLTYSSKNNITANYITKCANHGIWLYSSSNNTLTRNYVDTSYGIGSSFSSYNKIIENNVVNSTVGDWWFKLGVCSNNTIYHNNFIDYADRMNVAEAFNSSWDNGYPSGGNYWSDYTGVDGNGDGIGDTPYYIWTNNTDRYPLMYPYEIIPLLEPASSEAFQLSLEPITGGWGAPNTEYRVTLRKIVNYGIDVLSLFDPDAGGVAKAVWNIITPDVDGDGEVNQSESNDALQTLVMHLTLELSRLSCRQRLEYWAATAQISFETLSYVGTLALAGGIVSVTISNSLMVGGALGPVLICGGIWPFSSDIDLCSVNILSGDYQTITYLSPVELEVVTESGLILNSTVNQIPGAEYVIRDFDADGDVDGKVVLPNSTQSYSFRAIPKEEADPMDNYTLTVGADWCQLVLLKDNKIENVSSTGYALKAFNQTSLDEMARQILEGEQPVGGIYIPVNNLELLAPYIGFAVLLAVTVTTVVFCRHKKRKP